MKSKFTIILAVSVLVLAQQGCKSKAEKEASKLLTSVEQGAAISQLKLAKLYAKGEGVPQDKIYAYMWANFADSQGLGASAIELKNQLVAQMTTAEIETAEKLTLECREKSYKDC